jgi:hypothetical protein
MGTPTSTPPTGSRMFGGRSPARTPAETPVIRRTPLLDQFERDYARTRRETATFSRALETFEALWIEARALNSDFPGPWEADLAPDFAVARAINGLPPDA